jgi:hypothetical protein
VIAQALQTEQPRSLRRAWRAAVAGGVCLLTGLLMAVRPETAPLIAITAAFAIISAHWRRGVWALLVLMPFAGVPAFIGGTAGLAVRDAAIVLPLHAGFVFAFARADQVIELPPLGVALGGLALLAVAVVAGMAQAPSASVGMLGAKVWLAYVPLVVVGYHFVRDVKDFDRALRVTALLGLVPAALAIAEWIVAARTGGFGVFAHIYGASSVTAFDFIFGTEGRFVMITRVPSTFTSSSAYYGFATVAFAAALSQALRRGGAGWVACSVVLAAGAVASGNRAAYVAVPMITLGSLLLAGPRPRHVVFAAVAGGLMVLAMAAFGANPLLVASLLPGHVHVTLAHGWHEMRDGLTLFGHGTGWDTNAALRYGDTEQSRYIENWFAKASLELGIAGLVAAVAIVGSLALRVVTVQRRLALPERRLAAPVVAVLLLTMVTLFKGPAIDFDPLNVYFWLLVGMLLGLAKATARGDRDARVGAVEAEDAA